MLQAVGVTPQLVVPDCLALRELWRVEAPDAVHSAVIDLGASGATISIEKAGRLWVRSVAKGGEVVTRALSKELKLTWAQAEQLKRDYSRARRFKPLHEILVPCIDDLLREVARCMESYQQMEDKRPAELVCTGGGMLLTGLLDVLRQGEF